MPEWLVLTIATGVFIAIARAAKGLVKYVFCVFSILMAGLAFSAAITDLVVVTVLVVIAAAIGVLYVMKFLFGRRKSRHRQTQHVTHVHDHRHHNGP